MPIYLQDAKMVADARGRRTREGYFIGTAKVARTGIQEYLGSEFGKDEMDVVRVYRPEEEVFDEAAMSSYAHRPVTVGHPEKLVSADSYSNSKAVGHTTDEVIRDGNFVRVPLMVMDRAAADRLEAGAQFSMGYEMDLDWTPGKTPQGEAYDAVQRGLRMNHVAIVDQARGGSQLVIDTQPEGVREMPDTKTMTVDGIPIPVTDAAEAAIKRLQQQASDQEAAHKKAMDAKDAEIADMKKKKEEAEGEAAAHKKKAEDATMTPERLTQMVADRKKVTDGYRKLTGKDADDKATDAALMKEAVDGVLGDDTPTSEDAVSAAFRALLASNQSSVNDQDPLRQAANDGIRSSTATNDSAIFDLAGVKMKKEG
jgi:hypothetical protein